MAVQGLLKKLILMFIMSSAIKIWLFPKLDMLKKSLQSPISPSCYYFGYILHETNIVRLVINNTVIKLSQFINSDITRDTLSGLVEREFDL